MVSTQKLLANIIRDVQHMMQQQPGTASWSDATAVTGHIQALDQQPPSPRATWKKIVADLQVGWVVRQPWNC